jgi:1-acyl-sn-glycerol-3-phosphate acyltransferase
VLRGCAQVPIHRGGGDQEALEAFTDALRDGRLAGLAPEGRVDDHEGHEGLQRIRTGTARVAIPTGAPIVPLGLWGTQVRYPRKGFSLRRPWRPRLGMAFGPPIMPSDTEPTQEAIDDLTDRIRVHLDEQVTRARRLAGGRP